VAEDVRNEYVSRERAADVYGVVLTDGLEVDEAATAELRSS
jgi:N-methylhydantoinase B/oxoprolinase/acetone carboxylase alpha subunit